MRDYYDVIGVRPDAGAEEVRRACRRAADADPWEDEVAIDFPSTARVLDRVRASFPGNPERPGAPLVAEISISAYEAHHGADVPLALRVRTLCPSCGGRGEVWLDACAPCAGVGELVWPHRLRVTLPRGVEDGSRFRFALASEGAPVTPVELRIAIK
jgi:DnaJ-class molecular chaperone